jgi:hypothetical protein
MLQFSDEITGDDLRIPSDGSKLDALADHDDGLWKFSHSVHMDNFSF